MQPVDWSEAFQIVAGGLLVVFLIMSILALTVHFLGKFFMNLEAKKKTAAAAEKAGEAAS